MRTGVGRLYTFYFPTYRKMTTSLGTCDSANADPLPRIAGNVRPKRVPDDVDLATCHVIILLQSISM